MTITEVAEKLSEYTEKEYTTTKEVVQDLIEFGRADHIYAFHDEHLGLDTDVSDEFLETDLTTVETNSKFKSDKQKVVEQAEIIFKLAEKNFTEDDEEYIEEEIKYRGIEGNEL